jgi:hypothetical protein
MDGLWMGVMDGFEGDKERGPERDSRIAEQAQRQQEDERDGQQPRL